MANTMPETVAEFFDSEGLLRREHEPEEIVEELGGLGIPALRISQEILHRLEHRRRSAVRLVLRRDYEEKVQAGIYPQHETHMPLFPYQREGMMHLAFNERALLADEMGLGKTIQAIAACALLHRMGKAGRVLVVTPASLKSRVGGTNSAFHGAFLSAGLRSSPRTAPSAAASSVFYDRQLRTDRA